MTSTEIAVRDNGVVAERDVIDGWLPVVSDVIKLANHIADTDFVPEVYRGNPPAVAAAILAGRELSLGPMTSLRHVQVVKGTPSLSAEYKRARVLAAGHEFDILELNTTRCRVSGRRRGSTKPALEITFTIEDARKAGLIKDRGAWQTRPRRMLFARASAELCDFLFSDVVNGLPTSELLTDGGGEVDEFGGYDEPPADASKPQRTAQRASARAKSPAAGVGHSPQSATPPAPPQGQPPLPGEEEDASDPVAKQEPPAQNGRSEDVDKDAPGSVSRAQLTKIGAIFTDYGFGRGERDQRLGVCQKIVCREVESSSDLSLNEARVLIDTLERCGNRENLIALLAAGEAPPGEAALAAAERAFAEGDRSE